MKWTISVPQMMEFTGPSFAQLRTRDWPQFIHPDDTEGHVRAWKQAVRNGLAFEFESRFRRFNGEYRWHFTRPLPMRDAAGAIVMWPSTVVKSSASQRNLSQMS